MTYPMKAILGFFCCAAVGFAADQPNFVVIMADDLGYADISCFGGTKYETPHLDRLASEGIRLTDFHSNGPVCSPTRAALLTGRYQQRAGVAGVIYADPKQNRHHGLQLAEETFAEALSAVGYKCGIFGKWHLGYEVQYNPTRQGFGQFWGYVSGNVCYQSHLDRMGIEDWWKNDQLTPEPGYCTHLITRHAVEFIEANKDGPFCVYVAHESVHSPFQGPNDPPVRKRGQVGDIRSNKVTDIPRAYREMIIEMDNGIGQIVETLKKHHLDQKTLVLFLSDNGATPQGSNAPWKGFKGSLWEGGHRVPFIARHPEQIPAAAVSETPAMTIDIMPTLLELAGARVPDRLDGQSLVPVLHQSGQLAERALHWEYQDRWAIRRGRWKLISERTGKNRITQAQLFDLQNDPTEENGVSNEFTDIARRLFEQHSRWRQNVTQDATRQPEADLADQ